MALLDNLEGELANLAIRVDEIERQDEDRRMHRRFEGLSGLKIERLENTVSQMAKVIKLQQEAIAELAYDLEELKEGN